MYVRVWDSGAELNEPDDFQRFSVLADGMDTGQLDDALARRGLGSLRGDHAYLVPERVMQLAGVQVSEEWQAGFRSMIDYASHKGWVDDQGNLRAHCVYELR